MLLLFFLFLFWFLLRLLQACQQSCTVTHRYGTCTTTRRSRFAGATNTAPHTHIRLHVGCFQIVLAAFIWIMVGNIVLLGTVGFFVRWLSDDDDEYLLG